MNKTKPIMHKYTIITHIFIVIFFLWIIYKTCLSMPRSRQWLSPRRATIFCSRNPWRWVLGFKVPVLVSRNPQMSLVFYALTLCATDFLCVQTTPADCTAIVEACTQSGVMLSVGHVLRYDPTIHMIKVILCVCVLFLILVRLQY